ncbi:hypothetical protein [Streptomyces cylindrosporus]|uniref:Tat pathway signal sequence domain protein n=1 Tax=Streptomyces cylindrosporus TaxID=2927583 RepID=A0ABS9XZW4_9ACTN|nr:hypothetical protein [Streptomyces cylindrosporus]MCI3270459.1 hypothetical protein [Streptomyces cylindrosporus]
MSGIGPVEPVGSAGSGDGRDVIGADAPRLTDRWPAVSPRVRRNALGAGVIAAVTAVALLAPQAGSPDHARPPEPMPYPANVTDWHYLGLGAPLGSRATAGSFRFDVSVDSGPPVTLTVLDAAFPGLVAHATPRPAFTVPAGTTRRVTVEISVSDCSGLPPNADLPFLDVTLRNTRAIQHHSFIFGGAYARDLSTLFHRACNRSPARSAPRPSGSAGSQNADRA